MARALRTALRLSLAQPIGPPATSRARGFSLIELVVVITIVSVMSLGVVLGFGGGAQLLPGVRAGDPAGQASRFEAALTDAAQSALFGRETMGIQPLSTGWEVLRYNATSEEWQLVQSSGALEMPVAWTLANLPYPAPDARISGAQPPIRVLGDGRMTAFSLRLGVQADARLCSAARVAALTCVRTGG